MDTTQDNQNQFDKEEFMNDLFSELGLDAISGENKERLLEAIRQRIDQKVLYTIMANLTPEQVKEVKEEIAQGKPEDQVILEKSSQITGLNELLLNGLSDLYDELKANAQLLKS